MQYLRLWHPPWHARLERSCMSSKGYRRRSYNDELNALRNKIETIPAPIKDRNRELSRFASASGSDLSDIKANMPTVVDLFCGAGGLSLGFTQAGFRISLACDLDAVACNTFGSTIQI